MPSINIELDYFQHFKTRRIIAKFGAGSEVVLIRLLCFAAKTFPKDGIFKELPLKELIFLADLSMFREPEKIIQGLVDVKSLKITKKKWYAIHEWEEYQGHIMALKIRSQLANKKRWDNIRRMEAEKEKPMTREQTKKAWDN